MLRSKMKLCIVMHLKVFFVHVLPLACASSFQAPGLLYKGFFFFTALFLFENVSTPNFLYNLTFLCQKIHRREISQPWSSTLNTDFSFSEYVVNNSLDQDEIYIQAHHTIWQPTLGLPTFSLIAKKLDSVWLDFSFSKYEFEFLTAKL